MKSEIAESILNALIGKEVTIQDDETLSENTGILHKVDILGCPHYFLSYPEHVDTVWLVFTSNLMLDFTFKTAYITIKKSIKYKEE